MNPGWGVKLRLNLRNLLIVAAIATCAYLLFQIIDKNLTYWPDYSFHLHNIWAVSKGFLAHDPFLAGGAHMPLAYGAPVTFLGVLVYPLLGAYTVGFLLILAAPLLWFSSRKVFEHLVERKTATVGALVALLNPFTMYLFLTAKLPFIWGLCFALMSIHFYYGRKWWLASGLGALAVITHPMAIFFLGAPILLDRKPVRWLKANFVPSAIFFVQLMLLFGISSSPHPEVHVLNVMFLAGALAIVLWLRRDCWLLCLVGLLAIGFSVAGGLFGLPVPGSLMWDRIGFVALLFALPFLIQRYALLAPVFMLLSAGVVVAHSPIPDNPAIYDNLPPELTESLSAGEVRYASDGSALYLLPKLGIRLSNAGRESSERVPDNLEAYAELIEAENASYILIYDGYSEFSWRAEAEEKLVQELGYPLIYSQDNVKIYKTWLAPKNIP